MRSLPCACSPHMVRGMLLSLTCWCCLLIFHTGRERDFLKQQQVRTHAMYLSTLVTVSEQLAQKLQKQFGREQYALWAIVATTLQVRKRLRRELK